MSTMMRLLNPTFLVFQAIHKKLKLNKYLVIDQLKNDDDLHIAVWVDLQF